MVTIEHRWYQIVLILAYLAPRNEYNEAIVSNNFQQLATITMAYFQRNYHITLIGDTNARLGTTVGDLKCIDRKNWAISFRDNFKMSILNSFPPNKGVFTWQRNKSKAILD